MATHGPGVDVLVGLTQSAHVLSIALAFVGAMICFAGWAAMMIRAQQREAWAPRPLTSKRPKARAATQTVRSAARAWLRAVATSFEAADGEASEPYLLPAPYAVAQRRLVVTVNLREARGTRQFRSDHSTLDRSPTPCSAPGRAAPWRLMQQVPAGSPRSGRSGLERRPRATPTPRARRSAPV